MTHFSRLSLHLQNDFLKIWEDKIQFQEVYLPEKLYFEVRKNLLWSEQWLERTDGRATVTRFVRNFRIRLHGTTRHVGNQKHTLSLSLRKHQNINCYSTVTLPRSDHDLEISNRCARRRSGQVLAKRFGTGGGIKEDVETEGSAIRDMEDIDVRLKAYRLVAFSAVTFCVLSVVSVSALLW